MKEVFISFIFPAQSRCKKNVSLIVKMKMTLYIIAFLIFLKIYFFL